jgi:hypothetical protein
MHFNNGSVSIALFYSKNSSLVWAQLFLEIPLLTSQKSIELSVFEASYYHQEPKPPFITSPQPTSVMDG